jgi:hypothetical protein
MAPAGRQQASERCKQSTIGGPEPRPWLLASEHGQLMSQDEQLDVLVELAAPAAEQQSQHSREGEIGERKEHPAILASGQRSRVVGPAAACAVQVDLVFARARET